MSKNLERFVKKGDVAHIRTALIVEIEEIYHKRITADQVRAAATQVAKLLPELWEPYAEKSFAKGMDLNKAHWDSSYQRDQQVYLDTNFSKKRFDHLVDVYEYLNEHSKF